MSYYNTSGDEICSTRAITDEIELKSISPSDELVSSERITDSTITQSNSTESTNTLTKEDDSSVIPKVKLFLYMFISKCVFPGFP
ncbi:unnamed protein product [Schistosoma mattheei]|uniref:Uncharacterized protein n=1 Tax=Schistosoma mattheei TaxID=31246 RepID=A0A3P7Y8R7_9TREM|nr:unnamed protein product [Schistosoma mattheei]